MRNIFNRILDFEVWNLIIVCFEKKMCIEMWEYIRCEEDFFLFCGFLLRLFFCRDVRKGILIKIFIL